RPNLVGNPNQGPKTRQQWFNTAAFTAPLSINTVIANNLDPLTAAGNSGKGVIRGPSYTSWDVGIFKNFRVTERSQLQFRSEWFNAFNNVNFGNPNTSLLTSTFGQISSAADARQIQFGLKLTF